MSISRPQSLLSYVDRPRVECLNEAIAHPLTLVFKDEAPEDEATYLESDTDEQLLIHIPFTQSVKVHSIVIQGQEESSAPLTVKLFVNRPTIGFAEATDYDGTQSFDLEKEVVMEGRPIPLRFVKFQNVTCLSLFVASNREDEETTKIKWMKLLGFTGEVMDVANIKKTEES